MIINKSIDRWKIWKLCGYNMVSVIYLGNYRWHEKIIDKKNDHLDYVLELSKLSFRYRQYDLRLLDHTIIWSYGSRSFASRHFIKFRTHSEMLPFQFYPLSIFRLLFFALFSNCCTVLFSFSKLFIVQWTKCVLFFLLKQFAWERLPSDFLINSPRSAFFRFHSCSSLLTSSFYPGRLNT